MVTPITNDIRVTDDCLSFWTCDPSHLPSLEQVVLALAATRDTVDRLDLVWIEEAAIQKIPLRIVATEGDTPPSYSATGTGTSPTSI